MTHIGLPLSILLNLALAPTDAAPNVVDTLARRGSLGVAFSPLPADKAKALNLEAGVGLVASSTIPGLTGEKAGLKAGDIIVTINGKPARAQGLSAYVRDLQVGKPVSFGVVRDDKPTELKADLVEKARDPGNSNYKVEYSHIVSHGKKMRTIITMPTKRGKHPALFFIQGFSPVSYDFTLATSKGDVATIDGPILHDFANQNFVTMRIEKPGVGDSEGGPFNDMDYMTELDIYKQALKQLKAWPSVDASNIFIFGHSMGGAFGPMVAAEDKVRGICVYGTAARTWFEYLLDTLRYQGLVAGDTFENTDESVRQSAKVVSLAFLFDNTAEQIKKAHPELTPYVDGLFPNGRFNEKALIFWRQLNQINFPSYWVKTDAHVLAVRGASDFVTYNADHKLIADVINKVTPGKGSWLELPDSDHLFHNFKTEQDSMRNFQRGQFNNSFSKVMMDWIKGIMSKPQ